jgi:hypothetical protein
MEVQPKLPSLQEIGEGVEPVTLTVLTQQVVVWTQDAQFVDQASLE